MITGTNLSARVAVGEPDSIISRLQRAVAYLHASYPDEGWGQYLANGSMDWAKPLWQVIRRAAGTQA